MSEVVQIKNNVCLLKISKTLREEYSKISSEQKIKYDMAILLSDDCHEWSVECDVVFVGTEDFLIQETEDGRFYSRPCLNNPVKGSNSNTDMLKNNSSLCTYGSYFPSFQQAFETTVSWLEIDPARLPRCYDPPIFPSDK